MRWRNDRDRFGEKGDDWFVTRARVQLPLTQYQLQRPRHVRIIVGSSPGINAVAACICGCVENPLTSLIIADIYGNSYFYNENETREVGRVKRSSENCAGTSKCRSGSDIHFNLDEYHHVRISAANVRAKVQGKENHFCTVLD